MEQFEIEFRKSVLKDLKAIPKKDQIGLLKKIRELASDPRPASCKKLSGQDRYRLRQGNYWILYEIHDGRLVVVVVRVGNRRDVYK